MAKILYFSDIHIAQHKRSVERLHHCLDALEWVFRTAQERKIDDIVFAGDLYQNRMNIDVLAYHLTFKVLERYCNGSTTLWLLLGNHDLWYHDKWDISSVAPLSALPGVTVIDKPCTLRVGGTDMDFLPYTHKPVEHLNLLREGAKERLGPKILVAHLATDGAQLNTLHNTRADVVIEHDGEMVKVDASCYRGWDKVFLGHYHGHQKVGPNAEYIGSPLQLNFGEAFQHKHIIIYDPQGGSQEYVRNDFSPQHFIIPEKDVDKYDIEKNFIRVEMANIGSADLIDLKKDLAGRKPGSLEIVPAPQVESNHFIEDAKAILYKEDEMLEAYLGQAEVGELKKNELLRIGKKICAIKAGD